MGSFCMILYLQLLEGDVDHSDGPSTFNIYLVASTNRKVQDQISLVFPSTTFLSDPGMFLFLFLVFYTHTNYPRKKPVRPLISTK